MYKHVKSLSSVCFGFPPHISKMLRGRWIQCNYWRATGFQENYIDLTYFSQSEFACQLNLPHVVVSIALDNGYVRLLKKTVDGASPSKINLYPSKNAFYPSKIRVDGYVDESMLATVQCNSHTLVSSSWSVVVVDAGGMSCPVEKVFSWPETCDSHSQCSLSPAAGCTGVSAPRDDRKLGVVLGANFYFHFGWRCDHRGEIGKKRKVFKA